MSSANKNEISCLLRKYFSGTLSPGEKIRLDSWLEEREEHRVLFERLHNDTRFAEEYGVFRRVDTERAWERFREGQGLGRRRRIGTWVRYAAVIMIPLIVGGIWWGISSGRKEKQPLVAQKSFPVLRKTDVILELADGKKMVLKGKQEKMIQVGEKLVVKQAAGELVYSDSVGNTRVDTNILRVPKGGEFKLQLADGTRVYLNSATKLKYPVAFEGEERRVYLEGEAYFEVAKDAERPFFVVTDEMTARVYGTEFNVNTSSENGVRTVLVEGKVGVTVRGSEREYVLKPSEMAFYDRGSGKVDVREVDTDLYTLWRKGMFVFERESLESIMETLSAWYDVEVFFQSESAKRLHFSGHMKRYEQIDEILHAITDATGVVFTINGKTVCVSR